jgi:hypothetical protein
MNPLLSTLRALAAGALPPEGVAEVRLALGEAWPGAPVELVDDDPAALLALVDEANAPASGRPSELGERLAAAWSHLVTEADVVDGVMGRLGEPRSALRGLGAAIEAGAGPAPDVARSFDPAGAAFGEALAAALADAAGEVDVADAVLGRLGLSGGAVGALDAGAVRAAWSSGIAAPPAGWSAWDAVAAKLASEGAVHPSWTASTPPVADAVRAAAGLAPQLGDVVLGEPSSDMDATLASLPAPANAVGPRAIAVWAPAIAGLLAWAAVWALWVQAPRSAADPVPETALAAVAEAYGVGVRLAGIGEVNVDELASDESVSVFVELPMGDDAPLIISVDEGVAL